MSARPNLEAGIAGNVGLNGVASGEEMPGESPGLARVVDWIERIFEEAAGIEGGTSRIVLTVPAPIGPLDTPLRLWPELDGVLWHPPRGAAFSGVGQGVRIDLAGPDRFDQLRDAALATWATVRSFSWPGLRAPTPRFFGGLAFEAGATGDPWGSFGDGGFTLPRWSYGQEEGRAFLRLILDLGEAADPGRRSLALTELELLWHTLEANDARVLSLPVASGATVRLDQQSIESWTTQIESIRALIRHGRFEKIVAARRADVELPQPIDPLAVLARLSHDFPTCTRFAFRRDGVTFLGATPERLIARRGLEIETEALAGSIKAGREDQAEQLLSSSKDLEEHMLVVREILRHLEPRCARIDHPDRPQIRRLRHVLHLLTPITGTLREPAHVLELVAALHPTPAVGGVPSRESVKWILEHEPAARGWYASPIGWFDAAGDGEFAVALRSGLVHDRRAWIYAGAGIVRDSDPVKEYQETGLKQKALLGALGVEG